MMTYSHWKKDIPENMFLWCLNTGKILKKFEQKSIDKKWPVQFTSDDEYLLINNNNKILAYKKGEYEKAEIEIKAKGATEFSISNSKEP